MASGGSMYAPFVQLELEKGSHCLCHIVVPAARMVGGVICKEALPSLSSAKVGVNPSHTPHHSGADRPHSTRMPNPCATRPPMCPLPSWRSHNHSYSGYSPSPPAYTAQRRCVACPRHPIQVRLLPFLCLQLKSKRRQLLASVQAWLHQP